MPIHYDFKCDHSSNPPSGILIMPIQGISGYSYGREAERVLTLASLRIFGADTEEGVARCRGSEAFYLHLVQAGLSDPQFERLRRAVAARDEEAAMSAAEALRDTMGNLSLDPIYKPLRELAHQLRRVGVTPDADALLAEIFSRLEALRTLAE